MKSSSQIVYLSSSLDTEEQRSKNAKIRNLLEEYGYIVELPQEYGICGENNKKNIELFNNDIEGIKRCDILALNMDAVDDGCLIELGIAYALGKRCVALWPTTQHTLPSNNMFKCLDTEGSL